ncbi:hypothetical protein IAT38_006524 [Cryptococcus sp. DSM 104549]
MPAVGGQTKKVTTYGRKKTQIISVHVDVTSESTSSPLPKPKERPPLRSKLSHDDYNIIPPPPALLPSKTSQPSKPSETSKPIPGKSKLGQVHTSPPSTPDIVFVKHVKTPAPARRTLRVSKDPESPEMVYVKQIKVAKRPGRAVIPCSPAAAVLAAVRGVSPVKSPTKSPSKASRSKSGRPRMVFEGVVLPLRTSKKSRGTQVEELADKLGKVAISSSLPESRSSLASLLSVCSSSTIHPFSSFIASQPFLPSPVNGIRKVGEASYSEVFGLLSEEGKELVIKVIPLFEGEVESEKQLPDCSAPEDVLREVEVTKRMGGVPGGGFVDFKGAYVVEGAYPATLLDHWDHYKSTEGSASVRPSAFSASQKYCIVVLTHSGVDLEFFTFDSPRARVQAAGIFWQVAETLARAEEWTKFEHRDMHEGQILLSPVAFSPKSKENYLDPTYTTIQTTIIDFGLSRLDMPKPTWTSIPEEVYEGKGVQWDCYRAMRDRVEAEEGEKGWERFHPVTNVLWLQYILRYIFDSKSLRKSASRRTPASSTSGSSRARKPKPDLIQSERAFTMLQQVDKALAWSLEAPTSGRRAGLRGASAGGAGEEGVGGVVEGLDGEKLASAGDVVRWGKKMGWTA